MTNQFAWLFLRDYCVLVECWFLLCTVTYSKTLSQISQLNSKHHVLHTFTFWHSLESCQFKFETRFFGIVHCFVDAIACNIVINYGLIWEYYVVNIDQTLTKLTTTKSIWKSHPLIQLIRNARRADFMKYNICVDNNIETDWDA